MSFLISPAYAQAAADAGGSNPIAQFLPLILIFVAFYFIFLRPQQQQQKTLKAKLEAVRKGDRVLTAGGIVGRVTRAGEGAKEIEVEIAPNVRVTVLRETLTDVLSGTTPAAANDTK